MAIKRGTKFGETITGTAAADQLFGLGGNDTLTGSGGNDTLDGGTGADKMSGGAGNDTFVVDNKGDKASEGANQGTDTVKSSITLTLGANVENLTLTGSAAINGSGNSLNNSLIGNAAANVLSGGMGNDVLSGGSGADNLQGGDGNDVLMPGSGSDTVDGGTGIDLVFYADATGAVTLDLLPSHGVTAGGAALGDVISNVEGFFGSAFADTLTLNEPGSNYDGFAYGGAGNDNITVGIGANVADVTLRVMRGDAGNDTLRGSTETAGLGGSTVDHFWLQYDKGYDFVSYFNSGQDKVRISAAEFNLPDGLVGQSLPLDQFLSNNGGNGIATTGAQRLVFDELTKILWADKDGSGDQFASIPIARLSTGIGGSAVFTADDFLIIA